MTSESMLMSVAYESGMKFNATGFTGMGPGSFPFSPLSSCAGTIRVASPYYATPSSVRKSLHDGTSQLILGAGESIGTLSQWVDIPDRHL